MARISSKDCGNSEMVTARKYEQGLFGMNHIRENEPQACPLKSVHVQHIRRSWRLAMEFPAVTGALFYQHLFLEDPELERLFRGSIIEQGQHLIRMISFVVDFAEDPETLRNVLVPIGKTHVAAGVKVTHFKHFARALLKTLHDVLENEYTEFVEAQWSLLLSAISSRLFVHDPWLFHKELMVKPDADTAHLTL